MAYYRLLESITETWMEYESEVGGAMDVYDSTDTETIWEGELREAPDKDFFVIWGIEFINNFNYTYTLQEGGSDGGWTEIPLT